MGATSIENDKQRRYDYIKKNTYFKFIKYIYEIRYYNFSRYIVYNILIEFAAIRAKLLV